RHAQEIDHGRHHDEAAADAHDGGEPADEGADGDRGNGADVELGVGKAPLEGQALDPRVLALKRRFPDSKLYISAIPPVAIGAFIGWLTAIMGVGGGFVMVPAMIYLLRMPTRMVIGTSTFQIVCVTAFTTVLQAMQNQSVDVLLSMPLILGGVIGAQYGVGFAERLKAEQLRAGLALLVLAVAVRMAMG